MARADFEKFYSGIYGDRWSGLVGALESAIPKIKFKNVFSDGPLLEGEIPRGSEGLLAYYVMDAASLECAKALAVKPGDRVLDMCAAPGGKSLALISALRQDGELIANELSEKRRERLIKVIQNYVPRDVRSRVWVQGKDATVFGLKAKESFDRILLDAPCSGEQHLLENPKEMELWTESRSKKLAIKQYSLLASAFEACKVGGRIVYSTCSISPLENDAVIEKLLKKKKNKVRVLRAPVDIPHSLTEYGCSVLPDMHHSGPIYFSVLEKSDFP